MPAIPLRRRNGDIAAETIVDAADYEALSMHRWYLASRGYAMRQIYSHYSEGRTFLKAELMHRRIMGLSKGDGLQVDHINRDKLDNRRANLRIVTQQQNSQNVAGGHGRSRVRGVHWRADRNCWWVRVGHNHKLYLGGHYQDLAEAERAAKRLRAELHTHATE